MTPKEVLRVLTMLKRIGSTPFPDDFQGIADDAEAMIYSQADRIAELEFENGILRTEKHADAEAIAGARAEALRDVEAIAKRYNDKNECMSCADTAHILGEISALIEKEG